MTEDTLPASATGVIAIDLDRLSANWRAVAERVSPASCGAVVKADAYGLGASRVIPALREAGCRTFFVATPDEVLSARHLAPHATLIALDGLLAGAADVLVEAGAIPALASLAEVAEWSAAALKRGRRLPAAIHIDTGLNRLGLSEADVHRLAGKAELLSGLDVRLVMSHLASADDPEDGKNERQRQAFDRLRKLLPAAPASLAASDGMMLGPAYHYDLVRPGYALYGGQAFRGGPTPVSAVVALRVRVLEVRDVDPGETVGYSGAWTTRRPSRIAILAAGYADGLPRSLSGSEGHERGLVRIDGHLAPIVGRVSMDLVTVDVTDVPDPVGRGAWADVIGPGLTIEALGHRAGTIGYEVLTRLGNRFHRRYVTRGADNSSAVAPAGPATAGAQS